VQNIHEWVDKKGIARKCLHAPLTQEKIDWTDWIENEIHVLKKVIIYILNTKYELIINKNL
jgi:hypothetical protein